MQANILFDISHLRFIGAGVADINANVLKITNIDSKRNDFYTDEFKTMYGTQKIKYTPGSVFAYSQFELANNDGEFNEAIRLKLEDAMNECVQLVETFLTFLWFEKDNSVGLWSTIAQIPSKNLSKSISNGMSFYDCIGNKGNTEFSEEQLKQTGELTKVYEKLCPSPNVSLSDKLATNFELDQFGEPFRTYIQTQKRIINYNQQNCIQRAFHFLILARKQNVLIFKIAYYMAVFECLYTTDSREITTKMSYRAAFFIADTPNESKDIFRTIGRAYEVRSKFLHGQKFKDDNDFSEKTLVNYATLLDGYLRRTFRKIFKERQDIFTEDEGVGNNREAFLNSLVFDTPFRKNKPPKK